MAIRDFFQSSKKAPARRVVEAFKNIHIWRSFLLGLGLVILATLLGHLVREYFDPTNIIMIYLLCVTISAVFGSLAAAILVSILSVLCFDFFFVIPHLTFAVADTQYIFTLIVFLLVGITVSYLTSRISKQNEVAVRRERETTALYTLGRDLVSSGGLESHIEAIIKRVKESLGFDISVILPDVENRSQLNIYPGVAEFSLDESERSGIISFFQRCGKGTENKTPILWETKTKLIPLVTSRGTIGVLAFKDGPVPEQERLLGAYADLAAVAIEGMQLANELHNAQVLKATEKLQTALLNAISHDLHTPLVSVIGVLSSLQEEGADLDDSAKKSLVQVAREDAERLNHLISNLLDESRIEAGAVRLSRQMSEVEDLVGAALEQLGSRASAHQINIDIPEDMPFISVDFGLMVQTLVNILDNAFKYSKAGSLVEIKGYHTAGQVQIEIIDRGVGISPQDLVNVFSKFYRTKHPNSVSGTGLGLSISKGIIEAHGGHIQAENRPGGGTIFRMTLPIEPK
jgi:two-component system, OmpR family, sensor histidine kinase KdpD